MNQIPTMESASASAPLGLSELSAQNPWPGLESYAEEDAAYFAAREAERDELLERVLQHRLTVLYGLSGLGKSSLVKAGLFPVLREHQCLPVYVRLNFAPEAAALVDQVFAAIAAAAQAAGAKMPVRQDGETLWEYFQRHGNAFWSQRNRLLTPVLAFDQFEEIFTLGAFRRADESKAFLEAIADLAEGRAPSEVKARLDRSPAEASRSFDFNRQACHVLLSLREDYLAYLEDLRRLMPSMGNRMRLRPLNGIQAMTVVRKPGGSLVTQAVAEEIVTAVVGARQRQRPAEEQEVDPALLSLLCRELNKRRLKDAAAQINAGMLTEQVRAGILGEFYEAAIGRVTAIARRFVEDKLLLASGQRDSVALEVAHEAGIDDAQIDMLVDERLVRREERGGIVRLELTHDVLTDVVRASRAQRAAQEAERRLRKSRRFAFVMTVLALVSIGLLVLIVDAYYWAKNNFLPPDSMLTLQRFRLGYDPLPALTKEPIPPGTFNMGEHDAAFIANLGENEKHFGVPGKAIQIVQPFFLGKTEVTYEQYDYYVWQQHRSGDTEIKFPNTAAGGRGNRPVVNVSLSDAVGYAAWLGKQIGQNCRLPTEAEWEYAARAGTTTVYHWGDEVGSNNANCNGCGSEWDNEESAPVRSFAANQFGLYDMSGNVWEWTCSNWRDRFDGSEQQCNDDTTDTQFRVLRGGSWFSDPDFARAAARSYLSPGSRSSSIGFRVLCSSPIE